ncbi:TPA: aromatic acid/H+ symport family MFS transporter [Stenotrophomonas maltophilia]|nr:aromatic acid/H+ symport family MFS transporter [Stenotrophomonas maltophilia]
MSAILQKGAVDVRAFVDAQKLSGFQWRVLGLCFLVVALDGFDTAAIGFIAPALSHDWSLSPGQLNPVLVAALGGLAVGAFACGPLADRFGRKRILMLSVLLFGGFSLASAWAGSVTELSVLRFLTGLGLGGAMPQAVTLTSEYCPQRRRSLLVTTMFCGFTLGSALGGVVSAHLLPLYGWRSVLALGGILPLLVLPALALWLPESARFLLLTPGNDARVARLLRAIAPLPAGWTGGFVDASDPVSTVGADRSPLRRLMAPELRQGTLLLWGAFFMSLLIIYLLTNWLPTLIKGTGLSLSQAALLTALFQIGGTLGSILLGAAMDRANPYRVLALAYLAGALCIGAIARYYTDFWLLGAFVAGVGFCISGSQVGANALAASFYPTASRATGVSWALGAGRIGSIVGSLSGGAMLGLGWGMHGIFSLLMIPAALAALLIFCMGRRYRPGAAPPAAAPVH